VGFESTQKSLDETLESDLEDENEDVQSSDSDELFSSEVDYSLLKKQFVIDPSFYGARQESLYLEFVTAQIEDAYETVRVQEEMYRLSDTETMDEREAEDTVQEILIQSVMGVDEIDISTKMRFNNWQMFNKALLSLYDAMNTVRTNDVNYTFNM
jgi:hypothetical protein